MGHALLEADDELEDDAIAAREQRLRDLREQQAARDAREARLRALEVDLDDCALEADLDAREARLRALDCRSSCLKTLPAPWITRLPPKL